MLQYQTRKKRVRDPNLPPPPTLLGQVKELRLTRENLDTLSARVAELEDQNKSLMRKIRNLETQINHLTNRVKQK